MSFGATLGNSIRPELRRHAPTVVYQSGCIIWIEFMVLSPYPLVICYIAIENHHRNSEFSHEKWWIFPVRYVKLPEGNHGYKWSWPGTRVHRLRSALRLYHLSTASPFTAASDLGDGMTAHPISGTQKTDSSHIELDISRYHMLHL